MTHSKNIGVFVPIPIVIEKKIQELFTDEGERTLALKLLVAICEKYVTNYAHIPFSCFISIHSENFLRPLLGRNRTFFKDMFRPFFMEEVPYLSGVYSKGYRFKKELLYGDYKLIPLQGYLFNIIETLRPSRKVKKAYPKEYKVLSLLNFQRCHLGNQNLIKDIELSSRIKMESILCTKNRKDDKITLKVSMKQKLRKESKRANIHTREGFKHVKKLEERLCIERRKYSVLSCSNTISISRDETTKRIHTNLSRMPSECIPYITLEREPLVEIDMVNCHYTLFGNILMGYKPQLYKELYKATEGEIRIISKALITSIKGDNIYDSISFDFSFTDVLPPDPQRMVQEFNNGSLTKSERSSKSFFCQEYRSLVSFVRWAVEGKLYEHLAISLFGSYLPEYRDQVKTILMEIFYGDQTRPDSMIKRQFRKNYPDVVRIVDGFKKYVSDNWNTLQDHDLYWGIRYKGDKLNRTESENGKASISTILMNVESGLFVDCLVPAIRKQGILALSKHDSILVKKSDLSRTIRIMNSVLQDEFGGPYFKLRNP